MKAPHTLHFFITKDNSQLSFVGEDTGLLGKKTLLCIKCLDIIGKKTATVDHPHGWTKWPRKPQEGIDPNKPWKSALTLLGINVHQGEKSFLAWRNARLILIATKAAHIITYNDIHGEISHSVLILQKMETWSTFRERFKDGHDSEDPKQSTADMTIFVQNLLQQMQSRCKTRCLCFSRDLFVFSFNCDVLDEMGNRIDELEQSINELKTEMGAEGSPSPVAPSKPKPEESQPAEGSA
ncbi:hypothetical protein HHK36_026498 [Tetracentron sinense]|uniref:Uncharacterized protein n=1 Tax=Tetracentron sinense TaxID=13715 RepID=A0A834YFJ6_TETSI|nr:hypothetical protein HHK36_026498 [Tetracentron sinense]